MNVLASLLEKEELLHVNAAKSITSIRQREESPSPVRTEFQRDRDRILHSKSFRRLKHKTQVFIAPEGDHFRTRLTHTLEVSQISRTIARALNLNEDLTEAIALGHDLGHTPFGHMGEKILDGLTNKRFRHYEQSLRVVDKLEYEGRGLNLTDLVRDGIIKHSKGFGEIISEDPDRLPLTLEGQIVRISDIIAYVNHDLDDALRAELINTDEIPGSVTKLLGNTFAQRINRIVVDIIRETLSAGLEVISIREDIYREIINLREFLFNRVYLRPAKEKERERIENIISVIFGYIINDPDKYLNDYPKGDSVERRALDFIAGMTDRFAINLYETIRKTGSS